LSRAHSLPLLLLLLQSRLSSLVLRGRKFQSGSLLCCILRLVVRILRLRLVELKLISVLLSSGVEIVMMLLLLLAEVNIQLLLSFVLSQRG
jgi:hypothetical protein